MPFQDRPKTQKQCHIPFTQVSNFSARGQKSCQRSVDKILTFFDPYPVLTFMKEFLYCYKVKYAYCLHFLYHLPVKVINLGSDTFGNPIFQTAL